MKGAALSIGRTPGKNNVSAPDQDASIVSLCQGRAGTQVFRFAFQLSPTSIFGIFAFFWSHHLLSIIIACLQLLL